MKEGSTPFQLSDWPFWRSSGKEGEICGPPICMTMHMPPRLSLSLSVLEEDDPILKNMFSVLKEPASLHLYIIQRPFKSAK